MQVLKWPAETTIGLDWEYTAFASDIRRFFSSALKFASFAQPPNLRTGFRFSEASQLSARRIVALRAEEAPGFPSTKVWTSAGSDLQRDKACPIARAPHQPNPASGGSLSSPPGRMRPPTLRRPHVPSRAQPLVSFPLSHFRPKCTRSWFRNPAAWPVVSAYG